MPSANRNAFMFGILWALCLLLGRTGACQSSTEPIVLHTDYLEYALGVNGLSLALSDARTKQDFLSKDRPQPFAVVSKGGNDYGSSSCRYRNGKLTCTFGASGVTAVIKVIAHAHYLVFAVASVSDPAVAQLSIGEMRVTLKTFSSDISEMVSDGAYAIAARSLNLQGRVIVSGMPVTISPSCTARYHLLGARFALIGCPASDLRAVLQEVVRKEGLPYSPLGGPFALDAGENRGSYLFATPSEQNIDQWIAMASLGGFA